MKITYQELEKACRADFAMNENPSAIELSYFNIEFEAWLKCARFLGALADDDMRG